MQDLTPIFKHQQMCFEHQEWDRTLGDLVVHYRYLLKAPQLVEKTGIF